MRRPSSLSPATLSRASSVGAAMRLAWPLSRLIPPARCRKAFRSAPTYGSAPRTTPTHCAGRLVGHAPGRLLSHRRSERCYPAAGSVRLSANQARTSRWARTNAKYEAALVALPGRLSFRRGCEQAAASSTLSAMSSSRSLSSVARLSGVCARRPKPSNPSIEGTCNIWLRQMSPAPHVKR